MKKIEFYKYHALDNNFLIIDIQDKRFGSINFNQLAENITNWRTGIGADGILVLTKSKRADCCIDLFNSDGSWAEKSGNGLRIVTAHYYNYYSKRKNLSFEINEEIAEAKIIRAGEKSLVD